MELLNKIRAPENRKTVKIVGGVIVSAALLSTVWLVVNSSAEASSRGLKEKLASEFPNTAITSVNCNIPAAGLCEVVAGRNVFYSTPDGRFAVVGSLLDLKDKVDLTDNRLRQLAAVGDAEGRINGGAAPKGAAQPPSGPVGAVGASAAPADAAHGAIVRVNLPKENAIVHNAGAPLKVTIFTDLNCGYCRRLHDDLKAAKDIEVTEFPIGILQADSADKAKLALCSRDRVAGVDAVYRGGELSTSGDCVAAAKAVADNTEFARQNGISGTPFLIRADGVSNSGWMPQQELRAFLSGGAAL